MSARVILVEDHPRIRMMMAGYLRECADIDLIAETGNGLEAFALAQQLSPDMLVMDLNLPGMEGDEIARQLKASGSSVKILLVSAHTDRFFIRELLSDCATGYLDKFDAHESLVEAICAIARGESGWFGAASGGNII
jgi:DNA-binding NarL/FixJ family response regulator